MSSGKNVFQFVESEKAQGFLKLELTSETLCTEKPGKKICTKLRPVDKLQAKYFTHKESAQVFASV